MQDIVISLAQTEVVWENKPVNLAHFEKMLSKASPSDLIVLPEMFNTGFTMNAEKNAEGMDGETVQWMKAQATSRQIHLAGTMIIKEGTRFFNRFILVFPTGETSHYDKRHRFSMAGEDQSFSAGGQNVTWEINGWKIRPQVCYDLRFPVWSRNSAHDPFDVLLYSANWPTRRIAHWKALLVARAIENQCYTAAVSRIGEDGAGIDYNGSSMAVDFDGNVLQLSENTDGFITERFEHKPLEERRKAFPVLNDADHFKLL